jgi:ABC-type nitrate/sulfonate/bicarbonate transport system permease component
VIRRWAPPAALVLGILAVWEGYCRLSGIAPTVLPSPSRVLEALWRFRADAVRHLIPTLGEAIVGFGIAIVVAILAAVAMDRVSGLRRAFQPLLVASQAIPVVAIAPLLVLWFGFGIEPKVLIVVLVTFFPMTIAVLDGFASAEGDAMDLMRSYGASPGQVLRKLRWPAALPSFFTGARIAVTYAVIGAVFGEYVGAYDGLGIWMQLSQNAFRTDLVFAAILLVAVLSMALYTLIAVTERLVIPWYRASRGAATGEPGTLRSTHVTTPTDAS